MATLTPSEIIDIAKVSQVLAENAVESAGLFGGKVNVGLSRKLYIERCAVEWKYDYDPTNDTDLRNTANYLYALCGKFALLGQVLVSGGGGGTVVPTSGGGGSTASLGFQYLIEINSADFATATTYDNAAIVGRTLKIFDNNNQVWIKNPIHWNYTSTGVEFTGIDSTADDYNYFIFIVNAGTSTAALDNDSETIEINNESTKVVSWTSGRQSRFGTFPSIQVWLLDTDTNKYYLSSVQPTIDAPPPDMTEVTYDFGSNVTGFILIK